MARLSSCNACTGLMFAAALRVFHNHLQRGSTALGPRYELWGYRSGSARPPHDP
jgi:hypothetical protein